jgi:hypothetical protein
MSAGTEQAKIKKAFDRFDFFTVIAQRAGLQPMIPANHNQSVMGQFELLPPAFVPAHSRSFCQDHFS